MEDTEIIVSGLSIGEDEYIQFRYSVHPLNSEKSKLLDIHFDLTGENFAKIQYLYFDIFGKYLQDSSVT